MKKFEEPAILAAIVAAIAAVFTLDVFYPMGTAVWIIYLLPLVLAFASRRPMVPVVSAVAICIIMAVGYVLDRRGIDPTVAMANRSMAGVVILIIGVVGRSMILARTALTRTEWVQQGQVAASRAVQGDKTVEALGDHVLRALAERSGARST